MNNYTVNDVDSYNNSKYFYLKKKTHSKTVL